MTGNRVPTVSIYVRVEGKIWQKKKNEQDAVITQTQKEKCNPDNNSTRAQDITNLNTTDAIIRAFTF